MTPSSGKRSTLRQQFTGRSLVVSIGAAIVLAFLIGWAGYGIHAATHPSSNVTVERTFTGTVTLVGNNGSSGCVKPDGSGNPVCTVFYLDPSQPPLQRGQKVKVAHERATDNGNGYDLLVVYTPGPNE